jgi:hypothetical protein
MHINEQTPESLKVSLEKYFEHVLIWTTTLPDSIGSLCTVFSRKEEICARDIFAVASQIPVTKKELLQQLTKEHGTPIFVIDHEKIRQNYREFKEYLPTVQAYYAVKANSNPEIVKTLFEMGCSSMLRPCLNL